MTFGRLLHNIIVLHLRKQLQTFWPFIYCDVVDMIISDLMLTSLQPREHSDTLSLSRSSFVSSINNLGHNFERCYFWGRGQTLMGKKMPPSWCPPQDPRRHGWSYKMLNTSIRNIETGAPNWISGMRLLRPIEDLRAPHWCPFCKRQNSTNAKTRGLLVTFGQTVVMRMIEKIIIYNRGRR